MKPLLWAEMTWEEIRDMRAEGVDLALLPIGGCEQHGPHLPLGTDTFLVEALARAVSSRTGVPVFPTLPFGGDPGGSKRWFGTVGLSPHALAVVLGELLESLLAQGFSRLLLVCGGAASATGARSAIEQVLLKHPKAQIGMRHLMEVSPRVQLAADAEGARPHALAPGNSSHGGAAETALIRHLAPGLLREERISDNLDRAGETVFTYALPDRSDLGHVGAPVCATAAMGAELFEALVTDWSYFVKRALVEEPPQRFDPSALPPRRPAHAHSEPPPAFQFGQFVSPDVSTPSELSDAAPGLFQAPVNAERN
jgi:creatinine amidohydrolase